MRTDKLSELSMNFSVDIIELVKDLKSQRESVISNQIGRSGMSIGANIREAHYAHGKADFVSKLQIALKEANETGYWLELLLRTKYIDEERYNFFRNQVQKLACYTCFINNHQRKIKQITIFPDPAPALCRAFSFLPFKYIPCTFLQITL